MTGDIAFIYTSRHAAAFSNARRPRRAASPKPQRSLTPGYGIPAPPRPSPQSRMLGAYEGCRRDYHRATSTRLGSMPRAAATHRSHALRQHAQGTADDWPLLAAGPQAAFFRRAGQPQLSCAYSRPASAFTLAAAALYSFQVCRHARKFPWPAARREGRWLRRPRAGHF